MKWQQENQDNTNTKDGNANHFFSNDLSAKIIYFIANWLYKNLHIVIIASLNLITFDKFVPFLSPNLFGTISFVWLL